MQAFGVLKPRGQRRRLHAMARSALAQYDVQVRRLSRVGDATNLIYRVETDGGQVLALRLARPGWRRPSDLRAEASWLEALARDTDLAVPRVVRTRDGEAVTTASVDGVPEAREATLMTWVPGRPLGARLTQPNLHKMGRLFAQLHIHGATWRAPASFAAGRFDRMFARGEPDVLLDAAQQDAFTPRSRAITQRSRQQVDAAYAGIDVADLRVIHCDLWHGNIKVHEGRLCPFDFEDTIWGYRLHDIAMAMLDLQEDVGNERYAVLLAAFKRGYCELLPWPDGELPVLQVGRYLWKLNWVARNERQQLAKFVEYCAGLFEGVLDRGELVLPARH